ncbi:MAG: ribbon-helix-helix domain-containing protein [Desulfovibrio sp.]|nr:ribbon-helix-helix domain-containing protein [Desulfovibrio sp.]
MSKLKETNINFRCDEEYAAELFRRAGASEMTRSEYIRAAVDFYHEKSPLYEKRIKDAEKIFSNIFVMLEKYKKFSKK